ncbi:hypothetical protein [Streptomyces triticiradicis]|uniref:Uncharacterized protein n=1 Tax=Streptomyces triticiradicis TaxID=2651189 RepID=A0A7J5DAU1_9ACTN|nr:hypothetical protein [Streptomyces triticiradicis]KAB1985908.1 hypothetical protein F8144_25540 [Streptomyces triticiradicis]
MYRWRRPPPAQETELTAYLRSTVWGPAEFVGWPPRWLVGEGLLTGALGTGSIVGAGVVGDRTGTPVLVSGEAGLVCAGILVLHLVLLRAGRALVGIVAALGVCLALQAPQAAAEVVPVGGGRAAAPLAAPSVEDGGRAGAGRVRRPCPSATRDGAPTGARVRRGCGRTARPGDALAVVHGPEGRTPSRALAAGAVTTGPLRGLAGLAAALLAGCVLAVVRSHRLTPSASTT